MPHNDGSDYYDWYYRNTLIGVALQLRLLSVCCLVPNSHPNCQPKKANLMNGFLQSILHFLDSDTTDGVRCFLSALKITKTCVYAG